jgi:hypothetical protein
MECYRLEKCGFFIHYSDSKEINCDQLISAYCKGSRMYECKRLMYFNQFGVPPSDHMMPDGKMIMVSAPHGT